VQVDTMVLNQAAAFAVELADRARAIALRYFRAPLELEHKADLTPVTQADREIENELRRMIIQRFPSHGIFGEEMERRESSSRFVWVLDPIDGTRSFITGIPLFGTLIALAYDGKPVLGVIDIPVTAERWIRVQGQPTIFNGKPCRASGCKRLREAKLCITTPDTFVGSYGRRLEALKTSVRWVRYGGDCYIFGMLASGFCDMVIECGLKPYDFMAVVPIVEGAGGVITDWEGNPLTVDSDGNVIGAATKELHAEALRTFSSQA